MKLLEPGNLTNEELEKEYQDVCESIEQGSYSTRDMLAQRMLEGEIIKRGFEIKTTYTLFKP